MPPIIPKPKAELKLFSLFINNFQETKSDENHNQRKARRPKIPVVAKIVRNELSEPPAECSSELVISPSSNCT